MNRYAIDHSRGRVVLAAADPEQARAKMSKLYGAGRYEPIALPNANPATGVATTPNTTMAKKAAKKAPKKAASTAPKKKAAPSLGDRVEKATAPKPAAKVKPVKATTDAPAKPMSGLDAAAQVLKTYKKAMTAKEIVALMREDGLWSSEAKTPEATIYSAMLTEVNKKGDQSRFEKKGPLFSFHEPKTKA